MSIDNQKLEAAVVVVVVVGDGGADSGGDGRGDASGIGILSEDGSFYQNRWCVNNAYQIARSPETISNGRGKTL